MSRRTQTLSLLFLIAPLAQGCDGVLLGGQGLNMERHDGVVQGGSIIDGWGQPSTNDASMSNPTDPDAAMLKPDATPSKSEAAMPKSDTAMPKSDTAMPKPDAAMPKPDAAMPKPDAAMPKPDTAMPKPDAGPPVVGPLQTFVNLDWNSFPADPGPAYTITGKVWVVKTSGSDSAAGTDAAPLKTINRALNLAQSGDLIRVHGGQYAEGTSGYQAMTVNKGVVLTAAAGESVTVVAKSGYTYGLAVEASDVVINGINLQGYVYGMQVGSSKAAQKNVVISNLTVTSPTSGWTEGIIAYSDTTKKGFATSEGLLIKNVQVLNTTMGISCNAGPCHDWKLENVKVVGRGGSGSGADAIAVEDGDNLLFLKVDVSKAAGDGIDTKATRVVVWDCKVHDLARNGIKLWHGGDIVNTLVHHTGADAAIVTEQGPKTRLLHTTVVYHNKGGGSGYSMTFGYDSQAAQTVEIIDSIVGNTNGGLYFNTKSTVQIKGSVFFGIDNGQVLERGSLGVTLSGGASKIASLGMGNANLFVDPKLTATYHLGASSPAIDKGQTLVTDYPAVDCQAKPRVKGQAPDPGPYEDY